MRKRYYIIFFTVLFLTCHYSVDAQSRKVSHKQKQTENIIKHQEKAAEKARQKELKRRYNIQTKPTQERIDKGRKNANDYNNQKRDNFLVRWKQKCKTRRYR